MGSSAGGFAFRASSFTPSEQEIVRQVFGSRFVAVSDPNVRSDSRLPGNVAVETVDDLYFVHSGEFVQKFLFELECPHPSFFEALGNPEILLFFCNYDSGDSYGYRIFEKGVPVRRRLYVNFATSDDGTPRGFELPWLNGEQYFDEEEEAMFCRNLETGEVQVECGLTAVLLRIAMKEYFGVCPWTELKYRCKFQRYHAIPLVETAEPPTKRPWWRRLW